MKKINDIKKSSKSRYFEIIAYPESMPKCWLEILENTTLQIAISPLHDKDKVTDYDLMVDPERHQNYNVGELKKPHYHILVVYGNTTTQNTCFNSICVDLNTKRIMNVSNLKNRWRYLVHLDNPDKYQYNPKDIICLNGFNINEICALTCEEKKQEIACIIQYCQENKIIEYGLLVDQMLGNEWFDIIYQNAFFFKTYLSSKRHANNIDNGDIQ